MNPAFKAMFRRMQADYKEVLLDKDRLSRVHAAFNLVFSAYSPDEGITPQLLTSISEVICVACPELSGPSAVVMKFGADDVEITVSFPDDAVIRSTVRVKDTVADLRTPLDVIADILREVLGPEFPPPYDHRSPPPEG